MLKVFVLSTHNQNEVNQNFQKFIDNNWLIVYFNDVLSSQWFAPYVAMARIKDIIEDYIDNILQPEKTVTRAEAAKIAAIILE